MEETNFFYLEFGNFCLDRKYDETIFQTSDLLDFSQTPCAVIIYCQISCRTLSCLLLSKGSFTWDKHQEKCGFLAWMQIPVFSIEEPHKILNHSQNNFSSCISKVLGRSIATDVSTLPLSQALPSPLQFIFSVSVGGIVKTYIDIRFHVGRRKPSGLCTLSITLNLQYSPGSNLLLL